MAERQGTDKYIHCSTCKKKFINDYDHIKVDFGYNRLNIRFKCCVQCRARAYAYTQSDLLSAQYAYQDGSNNVTQAKTEKQNASEALAKSKKKFNVCNISEQH